MIRSQKHNYIVRSPPEAKKFYGGDIVRKKIGQNTITLFDARRMRKNYRGKHRKEQNWTEARLLVFKKKRLSLGGGGGGL